MKAAVIAIALVVSLVLVVVISGITYHNQFNSFEIDITTSDKKMQTVHAKIFTSLKSQGMAIEKYGELVIKALEMATKGRYGENGVQSAMAWIKEQNPGIDPSLFKQMQRVIEANYNEFQAAQNTKLEQVNSYKKIATNFPGSLYAGMLGFPKKSFEELGRIVTTQATEEAFKSGKMDAINPFDEKKQK